MDKTNDPATSTVDREITATRVFDAPRELVWRMWTDPNHVAQWWGPRGFTTTTYNMDVKPGGVWRFVMHSPEGVDYQNKITYVEVLKPQRLVYQHGGGGGGGDKDVEPVNFTVTVTFEAQGDDKTKMHMQMLFPSAAAKRFTIEKYGADKGLVETLGRLEEHLAARPFVISRTFDAPRERVWKAWTEREQLMQWFGPKGFTMTTANLDCRPGGVFHYCLRSADGKEMWGKFVYREIVPPERIVWVNSFSDEKGGLTRHPFSPQAWPLEMLTTTTFDERDGKTTVTIVWTALNPTAEERETFDTSHDGMRMGWTGTFDQLAAYLERVGG